MVDENDKERPESEGDTPSKEEFPEGWQEDVAASSKTFEEEQPAAPQSDDIGDLAAPDAEESLIVNKIPSPEPPEHVQAASSEETEDFSDISLEDLEAIANGEEPKAKPVEEEVPLEQSEPIEAEEPAVSSVPISEGASLNEENNRMAQDMGFVVPPVEASRSGGAGKTIAFMLIGIVLLLFVAYSAAWFIYADKVKGEVAGFLSSFGAKNNENIQWKAGDIDVSGYPMAYNITFKDMSLVADDVDDQFTARLEQPLTVNWPIFSNEVTLNADNLTYRAQREGLKDGVAQKIVAKSQGIKSYLLLEQPLFMSLFNGVDPLAFSRAHASDKNFSMHVDDELAFGYSALSTDYGVEKKGGRYHYDVKFSIDDINTSGHYYDMLTAFGASQAAVESEYSSTLTESEQQEAGFSIAVDVSADASLPIESWKKNKKELDLTVNVGQLAFANKFVGVNMDAELHHSNESKMPYGWARLRLANYPGMFGTLTNIINGAVANLSMQMSILKGMQVDAKSIPEDLLEDSAKILASDDDGKNLTILARIEQDGSAYIADMPAQLALGKVSLIYVAKEMARQKAAKERADAEKSLVEDNDAVSVTVAPEAEESEVNADIIPDVTNEPEAVVPPAPIEGEVVVPSEPVSKAEDKAKPMDVQSVNDILGD